MVSVNAAQTGERPPLAPVAFDNEFVKLCRFAAQQLMEGRLEFLDGSPGSLFSVGFL